MSSRKLSIILFILLVFMGVNGLFSVPKTGANPIFLDCSDETGLDGEWGAASPALMRNMATIDFNGDGILDLFISKVFSSNPGLNRGDAFIGLGSNIQGSPTFERSDVFSSTTKPKSGASGYIFADFDNDGDTDFYSPNPDGHQLYEYNPINNSFEEVTTARGLNSSESTINATWGDYDGDGRVDLLVVCGENDGPGQHSSSSQKLYHNETNANGVVFVLANSFANFESSDAISTALMADIDGDYDLDILLIQTDSFTNNTSTYQENDGSGYFTNKSTGFGNVVASALRRNDNYATVTDVNNDGRLDLVFGNSRDVGYCLSDSVGNFSNAGRWGQTIALTDNPNIWDITAIDWDLDGFNDFLLSCRDNNHRAKLFGNRILELGHGHVESFTNFMSFTEMGGQRGMCVGDFSKADTTGVFSMTGFPEICFANDQPAEVETAYFFRRQPINVEDEKNNWVGFELSSPGGTSDGRCIGANVTVFADNLGHPGVSGPHIQTQYVDGGSGRASQRALDLVFGLADCSNPVDAEIGLPTGRTIHINHVPINGYTKVAVDGVLDDTVEVTRGYDVGSETLTFTFSWNTVGADVFDHDKIVFYTDDPNSCTPGGTVFSGESIISEVSSEEKIYSHQFVIEDVDCTPGCYFYYSVQSQSENMVMASSEHNFHIKVCPSSEPNN